MSQRCEVCGNQKYSENCETDVGNQADSKEFQIEETQNIISTECEGTWWPAVPIVLPFVGAGRRLVEPTELSSQTAIM